MYTLTIMVWLTMNQPPVVKTETYKSFNECEKTRIAYNIGYEYSLNQGSIAGYTTSCKNINM